MIHHQDAYLFGLFSTLAVALATLPLAQFLRTSLFLAIALIILATAAIVGYLWIRLRWSPRFKSTPSFPDSLWRLQTSVAQRLLDEKLMNEEATTSVSGETGTSSSAPYISRNIDQEVNELFEELSQNYLMFWLGELVKDKSGEMDEELKMHIKRDFWLTVNTLVDRLSKVDLVHFLTTDVVKKITGHFEKIRLAQHPSQMQHPTQTPGTTTSAVNAASTGCPLDPDTTHLTVDAHLCSEQREMEFLAKLSDVLVLLLLPVPYSRCLSSRHLFKQLLTRYVLHPAINCITDPDFINLSIVSWIRRNKDGWRSAVKTPLMVHPASHPLPADSSWMANDCAPSYDEFLARIASCTDEAALKQIRFNIITEIVQATTMGNLSVAKGGSQSSAESRIQKYINQLLQARHLCDQKLQQLEGTCNPDCSAPGGSGSRTSVDHTDLGSDTQPQVSFASVMMSPESRKLLFSFLEDMDPPQQDLLGFWTAVEQLKEADRTQWHQIGTEIFYTFINRPNGVIRLKKSGLKRIEEFLLGDAEPDVFFDIQADVLKTLEDKFFVLFLQSSHYRQMNHIQRGAEETSRDMPGKDQGDHDAMSQEADQESRAEVVSGDSSGPTFSYSTKTHLSNVAGKLQNKVQAFKALKSSLKPDSKVLKMLQDEITALEETHKEMEHHLVRTEAWSQHLGKWRCRIQSVDHVEDQELLRVVLIVHVPVDKGESTGECKAPSWACTRDVADFHHLHKNLSACQSWIKNMELPSGSKSLFGGGRHSSKVWQEKAKSMLQHYMDTVLADDRLSQSQVVYSFFTPSPDFSKLTSSLTRSSSKSRFHVPQSQMQPQKFTTSLSSLFRCNESVASTTLDPAVATAASAATATASATSGSTNMLMGPANSLETECPAEAKREDFAFMRSTSSDSSHQGDDHDEDLFWLDEFDSCKNADDLRDGGDSIAEPLYALICEVFDMRGVFKILRKSLITVVQISYGNTISRQIRDGVAWLTSELMILQLVSSVRRACAPSSLQASKWPRQPEVAHQCKVEAQECVLANIPDILVNLVGQQAARNGTLKVFEVLQNQTLNKQLVYELLELLCTNLFPELLTSYAAQKLKGFTAQLD